MDKEHTCSIKGMCALLILFHHIVLFSELPEVFGWLGRIGCLICAAFFILSGYGLYCSWEKNQIIFISKFKNRLIGLALPFFAFECLHFLWCKLDGLTYEISVKRGELLGNWFFYAIIIQYIFFYVIFREFTKKTFAMKIILLLGADIVVCFLIYFIKWNGWWYNSVLAFPIGVCAAKYRKYINEMASRRINYIWGILALIWYEIIRAGVPFAPWFEIFSAPFFAIFLILFLWRARLDFKILLFLGEISYEIYLAQFVFLSGLHGNYIYIQDSIVYAIVVFVGTISVAYLAFCGSKRFRKVLYGKNK